MDKIQTFKSFSQLQTQLREEAKQKEIAAKREAAVAEFNELLSKYNVAKITDLNEEELEAFMAELNGSNQDAEEVSEEEAEEVENVDEAVQVEGKRSAKTVMNAYVKFFEKYPALGRNAMGVPADHHVGAIKELYQNAMEDANFSREVPATVGAMKGRLFPIELKVSDLNNYAVKVSAANLKDICSQNASIISGAAKYGGLGIVEGTAMYLDSIGKTKQAEDLIARFKAASGY